VTITSNTTRSALIDFEVYGPTGAQVYQIWMDNLAFTAGVPRTLSRSWLVPAGAATGTYTLKIGVFSPGWGTLYFWHNSAATFSVQ
jgi:hypothetical protein